MPHELRIYLRNHEAAARAGYDLIRRTVSNQRHRPYAQELREVATESRGDLEALQLLMHRLGVPPDPVLGGALRLGERAGRLKPNGHLLRRAPLSDLVEIEGVLAAVQLKALGWRALAAAHLVDGDPDIDLNGLISRADRQLERLRVVHDTVAAASLLAH